MTTCFLAPDPIQSTQFIPGGNTPANGGQLFFYVAGSVSTKQTVYKDNAAAVAWSNPLVLDSGGNLPSGGEVWFPTGQAFKVVFAPATDNDPPTSPYWSKDNLAGINDVSTQTGVEWVSGPAPTFVGTTQFTLVGDQTLIFTAGRRLKTTNTGGTIYSTIMNSTFGVLTTVNVVNDSGALDSGLNAVFYAVADPSNPSISPSEVNRKGANVSSATNGTTNIWGTVGDYVHVTGTTNIFGFSTAPYAGAVRDLVFDGSLTLFSSGAITIPGNMNISTSPNTTMRVRADTVSSYTVASVRGELITSNQVFAGPVSGAASTGTYRGLVGIEASMTLLGSKSASSTNSISFVHTGGTGDVTFDWTLFDQYEFHFVQVVPATNAANMLATISEDSGSTYKSTSYSFAGFHGNSITSPTSYGNSSTINIFITDSVATLSNAVDGGVNGTVTIYKPSATIKKNLKVDVRFNTSDGNNPGYGIGAGYYFGDAGAWTGIKFAMNSGSIASGTIYAYGIRKS